MSALEKLEARLARMCGSVELARPRFDVEPLPVVAPRSVEETCELVRLAAADKLRVVPIGRGSKLGWCATPGHVDFALSTRNLQRIVNHVPYDGTITVEAGLGMDELAARCRAGGHFLTPDVPLPARRSIGGVVAAGESGADRLRFGPVRHHVLGTRTVLANGLATRSGGQLVKNVTGFDLHRLYCGSHGTLGVIVEVSLRLFPEPEHELRVTTRASELADALSHARHALALPARIVSLSVERTGDGFELAARLFGLREVVDAELASLLELWPRANQEAGAAARASSDAASTRQRLALSAHPSLRIACLPLRLDVVAPLVQRALADARVAGAFSLQPGIAELDVELASGLSDAGALATFLRSLRATLARHGASVALRNAPRTALVELDSFGDPAPGLDLMRSIQRSLDPEGVFATGRFHGGL
ncbi:MAG: FAD-binding oxidoreductase [Planctomycetes bacterium]|nr:FAD-binding oxidoreductase [Planctomycetota bacterium]